MVMFVYHLISTIFVHPFRHGQGQVAMSPRHALAWPGPQQPGLRLAGGKSCREADEGGGTVGAEGVEAKDAGIQTEFIMVHDG